MKKKVLAIICSTVLLTSMVGCGDDPSPSPEAPASEAAVAATEGATDMNGDGAVTIGFSVSTLNNPFFVTLKEGVEGKATELGYTVETVDAQDDPAKQLSDIEDLIQKDVDIMLINPTDSAAVVTAVESCNTAEIPVITVDRSSDGGEVTTHIASDNVAGGKMAGEYLLSLVGEGAQVVELEGIAGSSAARDRGAGFHEAVDGKLDVVNQQPADFDRAKGLTVMENMLQANPDIKGVFAHNDEMALGAIEALAAAGKTDVVVVGFDATDDAVAAVESGEMAATVAQNPTKIGEEAVMAAQTIIEGGTVEEFIPVELELVTKE